MEEPQPGWCEVPERQKVGVMAKRVWPDVAIAPGATLADEIEARGLSQAELARRMGRPVQVVNEIVRGKKAITAETALGLEDVLGVAAHFWLRLEADYQLSVARLARRRGGPRARRVGRVTATSAARPGPSRRRVASAQ